MSPLIEFTQQAMRDGKVDDGRRFVELSDQTLARMPANEPDPNGIRADNAQTHAYFEEGVGRLDEAERWARKAVDHARANVASGPNVGPQSFSDPRFGRVDWILGNLTELLTHT